VKNREIGTQLHNIFLDRRRIGSQCANLSNQTHLLRSSTGIATNPILSAPAFWISACQKEERIQPFANLVGGVSDGLFLW
jgi:hypothetical protein